MYVFIWSCRVGLIYIYSVHSDELSLPVTSKALLTSLLISIISTYRSHIRRPFDGTIRRASLEYVLVPTAVSTMRRALSPCDVEGSLDKPVNLSVLFGSSIPTSVFILLKRFCVLYYIVPEKCPANSFKWGSLRLAPIMLGLNARGLQVSF